MDKEKAKQALIEKIKSLQKNKKHEPRPNTLPPMPLPSVSIPHPAAGQSVQPPIAYEAKGELKMERRIETEEDFKKLPYEGKAKYENQLRTLNAMRKEGPEVVTKPKKMFYQHYDKDEIYKPNIGDHANPSGRPPNIPAHLYEGIQVRPRRPWIWVGDQNLPPVQYQQSNEQAFKNTMKKSNEEREESQQEKKPTTNKKVPKKKLARCLDDMAMQKQEDFNSNFDISESMDLSMDSGLVSDMKGKRNRKHGETILEDDQSGSGSSDEGNIDSFSDEMSDEMSDEDKMVNEKESKKKKMQNKRKSKK